MERKVEWERGPAQDSHVLYIIATDYLLLQTTGVPSS